MVYLLVLAVIFYGIYQYDYFAKGKNKFEIFLYLFVLLTAISAFKYRVGSDILSYMSEFETYLPLELLSFEDMLGDSQRQPGWIILMSALKSLSCDFTAFQIIQAIFLNFAVGRFIYRNSSHIFTATLFYFVFLSTELNFEVMRESFAVAFFLLALEAYKTNSWIKYYILILFSLSFHLSAFFLFALPLFKLLPMNQRAIWIYWGVLFVVCFFFLPVLHETLRGIELWGALDEKASSYLDSKKYQVELTLYYQIVNFFVLSVGYWITIVNGSHANVGRWLLQVTLLYFLFLMLNIGVPIFYRFNNYMLFPYLLLLSDTLYLVVNRHFLKRCRAFCLVLLLFFFIYPRLATYFEPANFRGVPVYRKYFPYHSIFTQEKDLLRERTF